MRILHVAAHLGGGVGKAHAALAEARQAAGCLESHRFLLLEAPQDRRFVDRIVAAGAEVVVAPDAAAIARHVEAADILQVEWWSHPRLYECLARRPLPPHRLVLWAHISGLAPPVIPSALAELAEVTAFTSACSFAAGNLQPEIARRPEAFMVANSGFGFSAPREPSERPSGPPRIGYLGTLDFAKLHPGVFAAIDAARSDIRVRLFGSVDPGGAVATAAAAMRRPERVSLEGHAGDPASALADLDVFFYPLSPDHYGTGENALVEAMSLGLCPLVLDNPAERAIVRHGETGIVAGSMEECAGWLDWMVGHPSEVASLGAAAARHVAAHHAPAATLSVFAALYDRAMAAAKRHCDYVEVLGAGPAEWFAASLGVPARGGEALPEASGLFGPTAAKGSIAHFRRCFPGETALWAIAG